MLVETYNICEPKGQKVGVLKAIIRSGIFKPTRRPKIAASSDTIRYNNIELRFTSSSQLGDRELDVFLMVLNAYDSNRDIWKHDTNEYKYIDIKTTTLIDAIRHTEPTKDRAREDALDVLDKVMSLSMRVKVNNKWAGYANLFSSGKDVDQGEVVRVGVNSDFIRDCMTFKRVDDFGTSRERKNFILDTYPNILDPVAKQLAYRLQSHKNQKGFPEMLPYEKTMDGMTLTKKKDRRKKAIEKFKIIADETEIPLYRPAKVTVSIGKSETAWVNTNSKKMQKYLP